MKHFRFLAIAASMLMAAAALSFIGCNGNDNPTVEFSVAPLTLEFDAIGGIQNLTVTGDWDQQPTTDAAWITFATTATRVAVTAAANTGEARTASIKVGTATVAVTQKAAGDDPANQRLSATPTSLTFVAESAPAQDVTVTAENVGAWSANSTDTWITIAEREGAFSVTVSDNTETTERTGTISLTATEYTGVVTISVRQAAGVIPSDSVTIDDLVGDWAVTSSFANSNGSWAVNHTATVVKIDNNTIRIDAFLGTATLFGEPVDLDSQTFTFNPDGNTLTIIDPNKTEVYWNDDYFCFIAVMQNLTYADNVGIDFPVYTVRSNGGVLSIDFRDPNGVSDGIDLCCVIASDKDTGEALGGFGSFYDTDFTKNSANPAPPLNNNSTTFSRYLPYTIKAF